MRARRQEFAASLSLSLYDQTHTHTAKEMEVLSFARVVLYPTKKSSSFLGRKLFFTLFSRFKLAFRRGAVHEVIRDGFNRSQASAERELRTRSLKYEFNVPHTYRLVSRSKNPHGTMTFPSRLPINPDE
jgi:hypothetical protein